ncbi:hypothetical protein BS78_K147000 [Paspalum vaginatum]|uniref:Uncharacterized protein n=1 Tax=Paspalum vaginatum TaxID=158149 RepID=A0A9W7X696_9POAL|nr:hypothetical protein BS78_K147000 [Paspalum vaginatum]
MVSSRQDAVTKFALEDPGDLRCFFGIERRYKRLGFAQQLLPISPSNHRRSCPPQRLWRQEAPSIWRPKREADRSGDGAPDVASASASASATSSAPAPRDAIISDPIAGDE